MADKDKPGGDTPKTPRRRATTPAKAAAKSRPSRKAKSKGGDAALDATMATKSKAKPAPKPRSSKRSAAKTGAKRSRTAAAAAPAPAVKGGSLRDSLDRFGDRVRGPWGAAAIAGGLAAAAALLSLRGSTARPENPAKPEKDRPGSDDAATGASEGEAPDEA